MTTGANRPVRKRNSVQQYSDDKPNCFTVKPKKGEGTIATDAAAAVNEGKPAAKPLKKRGRQGGSAPASASAAGTAAPRPVGRPRSTGRPVGRPPKKRPVGRPAGSRPVGRPPKVPKTTAVIQQQHVKQVPTTRTATLLPVGAAARSKHYESRRQANKLKTAEVRPHKKGGAANVAATATSAEQKQHKQPQQPPKQYDTILAHAAAIQPSISSLLHAPTGASRRRSVLDDSLIHLQQHQQQTTTTPWQTTSQQSSSQSSAPTWQNRSDHRPAISWCSLRQDNRSYMVTGDCLGQLALYDLHTKTTTTATTSAAVATDSSSTAATAVSSTNKVRPICVLETSASLRERDRVVTSRKVISYPNAVVQAAWCGNVVVVLTATELEAVAISGGGSSSDKCSTGGRLVWTVPVWTSLRDTSQNTKKILAQQSPTLQVVGSTSSDASRYQLLWTTGHRQLEEDNDSDDSDDDDDEESMRATTTTTTASTANSLLYIDFDAPSWQRTVGVENRTPAPPRTTIDPCQRLTLPPSSGGNDNNTVGMFRCWTTQWENQDSFLLIAQTGPDTIELLRASKPAAALTNTSANDDAAIADTAATTTTTGNLEISCRQALPYSSGRGGCQQVANSSSNNATAGERSKQQADNYMPIQDCCIQLFGDHVFVTGVARGIRMFVNASLLPVATFGETVQLHGKLVVWNRCAWIKLPPYAPSELRVEEPYCNSSNNNSSSSSNSNNISGGSSSSTSAGTSNGSSIITSKKKQVCWVERSDELAARASPNTKDEYCLVGIPHPYKGPAELRTTLYIWRPQGDTLTVHGPTGGCVSDVFVSDDWRMVCVGAETGHMFEWAPVLKTDFAGVMYPVGYKVVTDNLEYIEGEDELDHVVVPGEEAAPANSTTAAAEAGDEAAVDPDLAEALRLSLLEHERQQSLQREREESRICVLADPNDDQFMVPCWPEAPEVDENASSPGSPQRGRAFSSVAEEDIFEAHVLGALPETVAICSELKTLAQKRAQQEQESAAAAATTDKPKGKAKRSRTANIEVMLQSSINMDLQRSMDVLRGKWTSGKGSVLPGSGEVQQDPALLSSNSSTTTTNVEEGLEDVLQEPPDIERDLKKPAVVNNTGCSAEEKSLAMELLMLSPNSSGNQDVGEKKAARDSGAVPSSVAAGATTTTATAATTSQLRQGSAADATVADVAAEVNDETIVTPSEPSPTHAVAMTEQQPMLSTTIKDFGIGDDTEPPFSDTCAACFGRMVLHTCGKREKPIDYEALAQAEEERKERIAEEKQRARAEKRRLAEAKRRDARRQKKLEDDQRRLEEEARMRRLEAQRYEQARVREREEEAAYPAQSNWPQGINFQSRFATALPLTRDSPAPYQRAAQVYAGSGGQYGPGDRYIAQAPQSQERPYFSESSRRDPYSPGQSSGRETVNIGGTEVRTSASLHPVNALAALAGLAGSIATPVPTDGNGGFSEQCATSGDSSTERGNWTANGGTSNTQYGNHGSEERKGNITHAFTTVLNPGSSTTQNHMSSNGLLQDSPPQQQQPPLQEQPGYQPAPSAHFQSTGADDPSSALLVLSAASSVKSKEMDDQKRKSLPETLLPESTLGISLVQATEAERSSRQPQVDALLALSVSPTTKGGAVPTQQQQSDVVDADLLPQSTQQPQVDALLALSTASSERREEQIASEQQQSSLPMKAQGNSQPQVDSQLALSTASETTEDLVSQTPLPAASVPSTQARAEETPQPQADSLLAPSTASSEKKTFTTQSLEASQIEASPAETTTKVSLPTTVEATLPIQVLNGDPHDDRTVEVADRAGKEQGTPPQQMSEPEPPAVTVLQAEVVPTAQPAQPQQS